MTEQNKLSFEEELGQLEQIVQQLEQGDVPLKEALDKFQKGVILSKKLQNELTQAEKTLAKIINEDQVEEPFEKGAADE
ncbi:exodeoxyribonuclease VII small subunit [Ligilactobacillus ceti]|uniref:Exodeoxyribonuclease 7 small subunit n=1 Tax=Ligilactobacillus ceti DSM 22408 TaxID=1122146 RepID=A0A0R2KH39_9LACO|nr:exodeoxyribonuclease VII small subunit [Ligilactobacillus ceti]KRN88671.1 hypothetical protein IV53_GL000636 [Ligilactobacillus ceti DSM 22408]